MKKSLILFMASLMALGLSSNLSFSSGSDDLDTHQEKGSENETPSDFHEDMDKDSAGNMPGNIDNESPTDSSLDE